VSAVAAPARDPDLAPPVVRTKRRRWTSFILPVFTGVMIFYLATPVFLMILYSFNVLHNQEQPRQTARFICCTTQWWTEILDIPELNQALLTSIKVAIPAALVATALGSLIGIVLGRYSFGGRGLTNFVIFLAIAVPEIVLGSSLLAMIVQVNSIGVPLSPGYLTILLSHIGFSIAFVAVVVRARVQGLDGALESAAQDLYATPPQAFVKVTLPLILPGIVGGFLLAFVLSLDDFVITNFVNGTTNTFPTWVFGATRIGVPPHVNVWGTVLFSIGILVAAVNLIGGQRAARRASAR
jgi:spermidine/putrescine transport system permease protein